MDKNDAEKRIELSERIATTWQEIGGPQGKPEQIAKMIDAETEILGEIAAEHPAMAEQIETLCEQYSKLQESYGRGAN